MAKLTPRHTPEEFERLAELIYPEERRHLFTDKPWQGEGFRHFLDPQIICIEHYMPKNQPILPAALGRKPGRKPAA